MSMTGVLLSKDMEGEGMEFNSLNIIKDLLLSDRITEYEKKVILSNLPFADISERQINKDTIIEDLKICVNEMKKAMPTTIIEERMQKELDVISKLMSYEITHDELIELSFEVDCLYYECDLPPRKTNTIMEYVKIINSPKGNKR